jgi:hypothetical protein
MDENDKPSHWASTVSDFIRLCERAIQNFGWSGTFLLFVAFVLLWFPNADDKSRTYRMLVFGEDLPQNGLGWLWIGVTSLLLGAQRYYYRQRIRQKDHEIKRIGKEKSELQEKNILGETHEIGVRRKGRIMGLLALFVVMWGLADIIRQRRLAVEEKTRYRLFALRDQLRRTPHSDEDHVWFRQMDETFSRTIRALPRLSFYMLVAALVDLQQNKDEVLKLNALMSEMEERSELGRLFREYLETISLYVLNRHFVILNLIGAIALISSHVAQWRDDKQQKLAYALLRDEETSAFQELSQHPA